MMTEEQRKALKALSETNNIIPLKVCLDSMAVSFMNEILSKKKLSKKDVDDLEVFLQALDYLYISGEISPLHDREYDRLHTIFTENTGRYITNRYETSNGLKRVKHRYPDLKGTIVKVHFVSEEERKRSKRAHDSLQAWIDKSLSVLGPGTHNLGFYCKFDGVSVIFSLRKGKVVSAITRGDSDTGEGLDVTANFKDVSFPQYKDIDEMGLKTEVAMRQNDFQAYKKKYVSDTRKLTDPRTAASGLVNTVDLDPKFLKYLTIIPLATETVGKVDFVSDYEGLGIPDMIMLKIDKAYNIAFVQSVISEMGRIIAQCDVHCDGVVVRFIDDEDRRILGRDSTDCVNNFERAFKFPPETKVSYIEDVVFQIGLLGTITPVAKISPTVINGRTIRSVSLGSIDRLRSLNLKLKDKVIIEYDIIPYLDVDDEYDNSLNPNPIIVPPTKCSCCGEELVENPVLMCNNENCPSRAMGIINNYCTKMGIKSIGPSTIETFFNKGIVREIRDLYELKSKKQEVLELDGFGMKKFDNLIKEIKKVSVPISTLIGSIGIKYVGRRVAKAILSIYNIDELMSENMTEEKLQEINGVGPTTAKKILQGLQTSRELILFLLSRVDIRKEKTADGLKICFSGIRNKQFETHLENLGHEVQSSVTKDTRLLIVGSLNDANPTSKVTKAQSLGIEIIPISKAYSLFGF